MTTIRFAAKPYEINGWTVLRLPKEISAELPSRGQVMVKGTIDGVPLHTALEPDGNGSHWLNIDKQLQQATSITAGDDVTLEIESTKDWPEPVVPADWQAALKADPEVQKLWMSVTPMARWEWLRWINSSGKPETRQKHIEVSCSKLKSGLRRPCCFNRSMCCVPEVSKNGVLLEPAAAAQQR
jgi:hypothetical protein